MAEMGKAGEAINAKIGWPERYYAVVFTAQCSLSGDDMYEITADRTVTLAQQQPDFLGVESVRGDDGIGLTVSYWTDRDGIAQWHGHAEHMVAQAMGRQEFYDWYRIRIAEVVSERVFMSDNIVESHTAN
jgi:heme-degrading monooxygenase HmoA